MSRTYADLLSHLQLFRTTLIITCKAAFAELGMPMEKRKRSLADASGFQVKESARIQFRDLVCNHEAAKEFLARGSFSWNM